MSSRIVLKDFIQAVFEWCSDEDDSDDDADDETYVLLGAPMVSQADLMVANLGEDDNEDQDAQEGYF